MNEYALECFVKARLDDLRKAAAVRGVARRAAPQGWLRRAMTASSWHFRQPYAVSPRMPGASSAAS